MADINIGVFRPLNSYIEHKKPSKEFLALADGDKEV
jgi:hypothetical protein